MITIDEAIAKLQAAKKASKIKGQTVLYLSLTGSQVELRPIDDIVIVIDETPGAIVEVRSTLGFNLLDLGF